MTREARTRVQISALICSMVTGALFGVGIILVLTVPALNAHAGFWIAAVVGTSIIGTAPVAWWIAPRMRSRYGQSMRAVKHARPPAHPA